MDQSTWEKFTSHESLLAIGVTLVMVSLLLRGFAASSRRDSERRKQHLLDERRFGGTDLTAQLERPPGWFEKKAGLLATVTLLSGLAITVLSFFRK
jgi:hypothetical protein